MRGGISMVSNRYAKANNPLVPGYDPSKPKKYIMYLDENNLYGWAMCNAFPIRGFKWKRVMPTEEEILSMKENAKMGCILEVDLEYPPELQGAQQLSPGAGEKGRKKGMDAGLPKGVDERPGSETPGQQEAAANAS